MSGESEEWPDMIGSGGTAPSEAPTPLVFALAEVARLKAELAAANDRSHERNKVAIAAMQERDAIKERCTKLETALRETIERAGDHEDTTEEDERRWREALASLPTPAEEHGWCGDGPTEYPPDHTAEIATIRETAQREGWV